MREISGATVKQLNAKHPILTLYAAPCSPMTKQIADKDRTGSGDACSTQANDDVDVNNNRTDDPKSRPTPRKKRSIRPDINTSARFKQSTECPDTTAPMKRPNPYKTVDHWLLALGLHASILVINT